MLERNNEKTFIKLCEKRGWLTFKFEARTHDPDRIVLLPSGQAFLVELKAPGQVPRAGQLARIEQLRQHGQWVQWSDSPYWLINWIERGGK